jgi:class 3 adenylate cyclase
LGVIDRALVFTLLPIWAFWFALYLNNLARGHIAALPIRVSVPETPDSYPTVLGFWNVPWGGLQVGDRLLRIGEADLRGVWPVGFLARVYSETDATLKVPLVFLRDGRRHDALLPLSPTPFAWVFAVVTISFVGTGLMLLLRKPNSELTRGAFMMGIVISLLLTPRGVPTPIAQTYIRYGLRFLCWLVVLPLVLRETFLFPEQPASEVRLPKWPWLFAIAAPIDSAWMVGVPPRLYAYAALAVDLTFVTTYLTRAVYGFFYLDPLSRRQVKWVVYGVFLALVPIYTVEVLVFFKPSMWQLSILVYLFFVIVPICVFIAVTHFNLFDIDRVISATAAYTVVSVVAIAGAIIILPPVAQAASEILRLDSVAGHLIVGLLLAVVVVQGSPRLRPQIERFFFAERYALERGVEHLLGELSTCEGPQEVLALVGKRLDYFLRPECCVVYGRSGGAYSPLFFRGRTVAPAINASSGLVSALRLENRSVEVERWLRGRALALSSSDRAVLDSLGAVVLVQIHRGGMVAAFLSLGQKRSGDIYTATDLTLLTAVAESASAELRRFDEAEIASQVRAMSDALRRYVPERIAAQVLSGQDLEARESDVSVLFVDIRAYTSYAEDRSAAEVFSTVNRYTEAVSHIVRAHGGTVVEFNGDGMMAVFGAPTHLTQKERAAVGAGREIVSTVKSLGLGLGQQQPDLEVGVGIATGKAFVGNIHSADRLIWSAIGDTTNLAARLQTLSRELNAAIVVDSTTRAGAGNAAEDFEQFDRMQIRGRRQTADVYALRM